MTDLCKIAKRYKTDKVEYGYTIIYSDYFEEMRDKELSIFEIGICDGSSLRMWAEYFPKCHVYGMDLAEEGSMRISSDLIKSMNKGRTRTFIGDQNKRSDLERCMSVFNSNFDIILDDGHHFQSPQQISLGFLFKYLKSGGTYIIEDVMTPWNLSHGSEWGQSDRVGLTDCTAIVMEKYLENKKIQSPYMTEEEINYLQDNIDSVKLYYPQKQRRGEGPIGPVDPDSPITGASMLAIITKK